MATNLKYSAQSIVDNLHTAVIIIDHNLQILCINPAAEELFSISRKQAAKKRFRQLILNSDDFFNRIKQTFISTHPYTVYEETLHLQNHQQFDVDYSVSPLVNSHDTPLLLLEFIRLKSQQKISHEENLLSQAQASKTLLRGLAHEIKNPLGGIRGSAQLLERQLSAEDKAYTQIIIKETQRLQNLLDRMIGPKEIPTKTPLNIHKILEHVRQLILAENKNISIQVDYDPSIPELLADENQLVQLILNLSRNAVVATKANGIIIYKTRTQRNVKIGSRLHALIAKIDVCDNGAGVKPALQETIFMPMITGHASGTGLGLSIAQSLAQQHEGLIEFNSQPGDTVFSLLLPLTSGV